MKRHGFLYVLIDPRDNEVRYLGQTYNTLRNRRNGHIMSRKDGTHRGNWICILFDAGLRPEIKPILEGEFTAEELDSLEISAIAEYRANGVRLTNQHDGGNTGGGYGAAWRNEDFRARRIAQCNDPEYREMLSKNTTELWANTEFRQKVLAAQKASGKWGTGHKWTEEQKAKLSASNLGKKHKPAPRVSCIKCHLECSMSGYPSHRTACAKKSLA